MICVRRDRPTIFYAEGYRRCCASVGLVINHNISLRAKNLLSGPVNDLVCFYRQQVISRGAAVRFLSVAHIPVVVDSKKVDLKSFAIFGRSRKELLAIADLISV